MGRIRRWFRGTLRPDALETDTVTTDHIDLADGDRVQFGDDSNHIDLFFDGGNLRSVDENNNNAGFQIQGGKTFLYAGVGSGIQINLTGSQAEFRTRLNLRDNAFSLTPQDVRNISSPSEGWYADHDGSGSNTAGLARYDGTNWISQVDGTTIS